MTTEQELLKQIWEIDGKIPLQLIAKRLGISIDYIGYLCKELIGKGLVKKFERDRYKITVKGRKSLAKLALITSAKKPSPRQRVAHKRRARKKARKKRKGGKKKVNKKSKKRIRKKPKKRKRKSTTKKITRKIKRKIPAPLSSEDEKISSIEQTPARDSKIAEESKPTTPSKKKKEPNKLLKTLKGLFGTKKE